MSIADFSLVKKRPLTIIREAQQRYEYGEVINGEDEELNILANVQPFSDYQTMILSESDRTKNWVWVFTSTPLRQKKEGVNGHGPDRFQWNGEWYEVMKTQTFQMGVRDHQEIKAVRIELTPN